MGFQQVVGLVVPPLAILFILGTPLRVGVYNVFFAIFSSICLIVVAQYRTPANRLKIYGICTLILACTTCFLGWQFTFAALIVYTIADGVVSPVMGVSSHVVDLKSMETGRKETDFYATMILRDFFLWVWRSVGGALFLLVIYFAADHKSLLTSGLYFLALSLVLTYAGAYLFLKMKR